MSIERVALAVGAVLVLVAINWGFALAAVHLAYYLVEAGLIGAVLTIWGANTVRDESLIKRDRDASRPAQVVQPPDDPGL